MPFGPVDANLDLVSLEARVLARWRADDLMARVAAARKDGEPWIFYEGPPTANGSPGLHHVWARAFKDLFPRYQTMRGRAVPRKGGWDCHGLPVELEIEKELGLANKHEIEAFGIAEFNRRCRESVQRYVEDWAALTERYGVWIDTDDAYWTLSNEYIESVWWIISRMWDDGLLYEGHRVVPYCPRCGTALSSHEVAQGYEDVVDASAYVRFPVTTGPDDTAASDLLVWTTTPWTLISNVAVAVGGELSYVRADVGAGHDLIMAEAAHARLYPDAPVVATFRGTDLVGVRYQRPFDFLTLDEQNALRVVPADYVSTDDGSGIVHLAPAFGEDDANVGRAEGLPTLNPVNADGEFDASVPLYAGRQVKDTDRDLIDDLGVRGLLVAEVPYEHSYPHCWRCGTPLIYWAKTAWFARTSERLDDLLAQNERIGWHPEHLKHGRFGKWLENNVDWALSRDRYWGTPLPIWRCDHGHDTCVGSVAQLTELAGRDLTELDLHRPAVDEVALACPVSGCGRPATRLPPVLDAWFDSGSMPSAQRHHPFEDAESFDAAFPADFICEAIDQTRGWFYSLLAVNTLVFGSTPYRNVVCLGHLVDEHGFKMSKSRGNTVDPWDIPATLGADALRWYFFSAGQPWLSRRVGTEQVREATRQTLITLWNVFSFHVTYADLDGWTPGEDPEPTHALDRWVLSRLDETTETMGAALDSFDAYSAASALVEFVDDLSNWYVRRSRRRFWTESDAAAHATLHECLVTTAELLAPFCPFLADEIHRDLTGSESVHLADWPGSGGRQDAALAERMVAARRLVGMGRAARTEAGIKVRQPLRRALLLHPGAELDDGARTEIAAELNVAALEDVDTLSGLITWEVTPNFRRLGPRLGTKMGEVKAALAASDGSVLRQQLEADGVVIVAGETLTADDVELRAKRHESFALTEEAGWAVALDLELDDGLRAEGVARELVRAVNALRKDLDLQLADRIRLGVTVDPQVDAARAAHGDWIAGEVLAVEIFPIEPDTPGAHGLSLDDHPIMVTVEVVSDPAAG